MLCVLIWNPVVVPSHFIITDYILLSYYFIHKTVTATVDSIFVKNELDKIHIQYTLTL
jgi:hypothetical protein